MADEARAVVDQSSVTSAEAMSTLASDDRLPFRKVFFYGLGNAAGLLLYNTFNTFIQFFYTDTVGLPSQWVGRGWFAFGFWNAVNDPIAGWLSDHTQTAVGRRTFYIRLIAIPVAVAFALVWLPPFDVDTHGPIAVLAYFLVIISIYDMLQTIITLNQDALFPEMFQDTGSRARGASIRQMVGFGLGGGIAIGLSPAIYESSLGWSGLAIMWGSIASLFYFLSLRGIEENPAYGQQTSEESVPAIDELKSVLRNRIFLINIAVNFVIRFVLAILAASLPFYAKYVLRIEGNQTAIITSTLIVAAVVAILGWQWVFRKIGTRNTMIASFGLASVFAVPFLFAQSLIITLISLVAMGIAIGGSLLGPDLLLAELIDEDYVRTRMRREGVYRGVLGFIFRFPPAFAGLIIGEMLAAAGYDADLSVRAQPGQVETVIRYFTSVGPLVAVILGVFLMVIYPLHGQRLAEIQEQAVALRKEMKNNSQA
jgi:GPH family glycoside/pentoside/hexuronide:cation symporter